MRIYRVVSLCSITMRYRFLNDIFFSVFKISLLCSTLPKLQIYLEVNIFIDQ